MPVRLTARQIIDQVCRAYRLDPLILQAKSQQRNASEARAAAGWLARESGCVTLTEIAGLVNRDVGSISSAVRRLSDRLGNEPDLAKRMKALKTVIEAKEQLNNLEA